MYPRIQEKVFNQVWAIAPASYDAIRATFLSHNPQAEFSADFSLTPKGESSLELASMPFGPVAEGVSVVSVSGVIGKRLSMLETACGGCDLDMVRSDFEAALADDAVESIILHMDTPGGTVTGLKELSDTIFEASQSSGKDIIAYTDSMCCSAGYHLASQCQYVAMVDSAIIGSIGCIITHVDVSENDKMQGVKYTTIKSGELKDLGNPHRPLEDAERERLQEQVDTHAQQFFAVVERARGEIGVAELQAGVFNGEAALAAQLIDGIHPTLNDLLAALKA